jgi:uracil-DNA glycosylase family 4
MMQEWEVELSKACEAIRTRLEALKSGGIEYIDKQTPTTATVDPSPVHPGSSLLSQLQSSVIGCRKCNLCETRNNIVFGAGHEKARLMFIGEAPGADEDKQGLPFVGRAGILLGKMIAAMGYTREEVYICNIVKCRPPENRDPEPDEIASCLPYLEEQIRIINPQVIVGLGRYACQTLLGTKTPMAQIRGQWQDRGGIKFMPTFHPAYLLRNPPAKKVVWEDLKAVVAELSGGSNTR